MAKPADLTALIRRLETAGFSRADLTWLGSFAFDDAAVPAIATATEAETYQRVSDALVATIQSVSLWERESLPETHLAGAIGARLADWRDGPDEDED